MVAGFVGFGGAVIVLYCIQDLKSTIYMGIWSLTAVLVVIVFLLFRTGHHYYHVRKAKRASSTKQTPTH
jgi:hypothetical protein